MSLQLYYENIIKILGSIPVLEVEDIDYAYFDIMDHKIHYPINNVYVCKDHYDFLSKEALCVYIHELSHYYQYLNKIEFNTRILYEEDAIKVSISLANMLNIEYVKLLSEMNNENISNIYE